MSPTSHIPELASLAELAMIQSLRCERAAEAIEDAPLASILTELSRDRTLLRLELEGRLRALGGLPMSQSAGNGGLNGLHAAQRMDVVPDTKSLIQQVTSAEEKLYTALITSCALGAIDPSTRLGIILDGMAEVSHRLIPNVKASLDPQGRNSTLARRVSARDWGDPSMPAQGRVS